MKNICKWKPSPIFPKHYVVSNNGEVKSLRTNKKLKPSIDKDGYAIYVLCESGKKITIKGHRLVAETYIPNREKKPCIDHINGDRKDNRVENLRWVTHKENSHNPITLKKLNENVIKNLPKLQEGAKRNNYGRRKTFVYRDGNIVGEYESQKAASIATGISESKISTSISKGKQYKGYLFIKGEE